MACFFCSYKIQPSYKDIDNLSKFLTQRKKIIGKERTNVCAKHQRRLTKQIKYARYLGLLPYISYRGIK